MKIKKPENFKDILKLQEHLDSKINSVRYSNVINC